MSVLLLHLDAALSEALTERLRRQGDEVRWLGPEKEAETQRRLGAFIARGDVADDDLVWRAAQGARTIVFTSDRSPEEVTAILKGAKNAKVERLICIAPESPVVTRERLDACGLEYVILLTGGGGWLARRKVSSTDLAEAVDAADDKSGPLHEVVDLTDERGWGRLGLAAPGKKP